MANATADRTTDDLYFGGRTIARSPARGGGGGHAASRGPRARCRAPAHAGLVVILPSFLLHRASVFAETHGVLDTKEIVRKMKIQIWNFAEALTSLGSLGSTWPSSCLFFSDRVDRRGQRTWTFRWRGRRRSGGGGGRGGWMDGGREGAQLQSDSGLKLLSQLPARMQTVAMQRHHFLLALRTRQKRGCNSSPRDECDIDTQHG